MPDVPDSVLVDPEIHFLKSEYAIMFGLFKTSPLKKMEKQYVAKLKEARDLQRKGDIVGYAQVFAEADSLLKQIEAAESSSERANT